METVEVLISTYYVILSVRLLGRAYPWLLIGSTKSPKLSLLKFGSRYVIYYNVLLLHANEN